MNVTLKDVVKALDTDSLVPVFQPQIDLRTGRAVSFEVLTRWDHPTYGLILPHNFISLAEENGLIGELTHQVLGKTFHSADSILPYPLTLAVNVSPIQLHYATLPAQIRLAAEEAGFDLARLTMEVTESALVKNLDLACKVAYGLRDLGCRLALDDFGTGYSSLLHLKALPFTDIKVDRSFVGAMIEARDARKIVSAVVSLGQSLGLTTIAEGVETDGQAEMLFRLGCDQGQGWLFGRPLTAHSIPRLVTAPPWQPSRGCLSAFAEGLGVSALHHSAELNAIYESVPVPLFLVDTNLRYVNANSKVAKLYGIALEDMVGRSLREVLPRAFSVFEKHIKRALRGESITGVPVIKPSHLHGGNDRLLMVSYQPAFDEAGEVVGVSVAMMDMTDQQFIQPAITQFPIAI